MTYHFKNYENNMTAHIRSLHSGYDLSVFDKTGHKVFYKVFYNKVIASNFLAKNYNGMEFIKKV